MTERLEEAIAKLRELSPDRQDEAAALLLSMVDQDSNVLHLTPQQAAEVARRIARPTEYVSHDGVRANYK